MDKKNDFWSSRTRSFSQKVCPFWIKLDFFYYLFIFFYFFFIFFYFFVNLYPTAATKWCIPHCCHQMLCTALSRLNVVNWIKKMIIEGGGVVKKMIFGGFIHPCAVPKYFLSNFYVDSPLPHSPPC